MNDGATLKMLGNTGWTLISSDLDHISFHESHIVVGDVVHLAVGHANAEWFKRLCIHHLFDLFGVEHAGSVFSQSVFFNRISYAIGIFGIQNPPSYFFALLIPGLRR